MSVFNKLGSLNKTKKKEVELKKDTFQKFIKFIFWFLLIFLITKSIIADVFEKEEEFVMPEIKLEHQGPAAVAASFVKEYLTYESGATADRDRDYKDRVYEFAAAHVKFPILGSLISGSRVENTFVFNVDKKNENQYDVLVRADVVYDSLDEESSIYVLVPIAQKDGKYAVEDIPVIVPPPDKADIEYAKYYEGEELYITEANKVKEIIENFFNTYCTGKPTEIAYYMDDGKPVKGFDNRFVFSYLKEFHVFDLKVNNMFKATALVELKDPISEKLFYQNYNIDLTQRDGRWYIKSLNIRGGNLNEKIQSTEQNENSN